MHQHLQMTRITVKGFATIGGSSLQIALTQRSCDSHLVLLGFTIFSSGKPRAANSLDALQCLCILGGIIEQLPNAGHGSKKTTTSLSPELKRAVTCDKNSGCRLHEQRRSEFAYELHLPSHQM